MRRGRFIVFEGGEGSGKSTQAKLLADQLGALLTREPGGTAVGERVRQLLLEDRSGRIERQTELLLMLAARAQHVAELIEPALASGRDVVCDRFSPSTLAYQGYGRGIDLQTIRSADRLATSGLEPDLVLLLDVPPELGAARRSGERDRIEGEDDEFFARVRAGYLAQAASDPSRWSVVDGDGTIETVRARVRSAVETRTTARVAAPPR